MDFSWYSLTAIWTWTASFSKRKELRTIWLKKEKNLCMALSDSHGEFSFLTGISLNMSGPFQIVKSRKYSENHPYKKIYFMFWKQLCCLSQKKNSKTLSSYISDFKKSKNINVWLCQRHQNVICRIKYSWIVIAEIIE